MAARQSTRRVRGQDLYDFEGEPNGHVIDVDGGQLREFSKKTGIRDRRYVSRGGGHILEKL